MKFIGFLLIALGGALLAMMKWLPAHAATVMVAGWIAKVPAIVPYTWHIGIGTLAVGVLFMMLGFIFGGRRSDY